MSPLREYRPHREAAGKQHADRHIQVLSLQKAIHCQGGYDIREEPCTSAEVASGGVSLRVRNQTCETSRSERDLRRHIQDRRINHPALGASSNRKRDRRCSLTRNCGPKAHRERCQCNSNSSWGNPTTCRYSMIVTGNRLAVEDAGLGP